MTIKSLLLGSAAVLALGTSAQAADPIAVALDTCDLLNITGLTISSESNCLKFEGAVEYKWKASTTNAANAPITTTSELNWNLKATATADSDFGPAVAVIKLGDTSKTVNTVSIDEAYVALGDASSTVLYAGKKGTIANHGDDKTFTAIFNTELDELNKIGAAGNQVAIGGHVLQASTSLGDGITGLVGLENLNTAGSATAVAGVTIAQDWGTAHASVAYDNLINSGVNNWALHTGATFNVDSASFLFGFTTDEASAWQAIISAKTTVDMVTLAAGANFKPGNVWGADLSAEFKADDATTITGAVHFANGNAWGVGVKAATKVSDTLTATALVKFDNTNKTSFEGDLDWAPGGGATVNFGLNTDSTGASSVETKFKKTFE
jgi:hypothetical protein